MLATGAAIGASALFGPAAAQGATFEVNNTGDGAADACDANCTLRDAVTLADGTAGADTVTFASGLTGTIRLTAGEIPIASGDPLTITGPGASSLSVSGDADNSGGATPGDSRIFTINATPVSISGLTLTGGFANADGGALNADQSAVTIADSVVSNSRTDDDGGGIATNGGSLTITGSTLTGNAAPNSYGGAISSDFVTISHSTISGNDADVAAGVVGRLTMDSSSITGNDATQAAGGLFSFGEMDITNSTISGNTSGGPGGGIAHIGYTGSEISHSTLSGNSSVSHGGAIFVIALAYGGNLTVSQSTISGNSATGPAAFGGGIMLPGNVYGPVGGNGDFDVVDSTISGNTAPNGGGVAVGGPYDVPQTLNSTIEFANSTIAANSASVHGGGIYIGQYDVDPGPGTVNVSPTIALTSTIAGDNTAAGAAQDLDRADGSAEGGFDLSYSLVEAAGDAPLTQNPGGSSIVGADPQLGGLADNGGPTLTHLPARTSPAIDAGNSPARLTLDQRDLIRLVDTDAANPPGGDGTDIGAVELERLPPNPPPVLPPPPPPPPPVLPQDLAPQAVIKKNGLRARKASRRVVSGTATDDNKVVKVEIALVHKTGGNCRELLASGRFSKKRRCRRPRSFITAKGTTRWSYKLRHRLKRGYYVVYSRATDDAGHKQFSFGTKSRRPFRVR